MTSNFLLYQTPEGQTRLEVRLQDETVWLSLTDMSNLFQRDKSVISRHIRNTFAEGELVRDSVIANFATTAADGKTYQVEHFNLDVIISVGYRVRSHRSCLVLPSSPHAGTVAVCIANLGRVKVIAY